MKVAGRWWRRVALGLVVILGLVSHAPALLAFPYHQRFGVVEVRSEQPIPAQITAVLARADRLIALSPVAGGGLSRDIFLTDGGWRWRLTALTSSGAFGLRTPLSSALVFNRSDVVKDRIFNGRAIGGDRTLSGTIAHETAHLLVARRIGEWVAATAPSWKQEGFADYVAQESSLSDAEAAALRKSEPSAPALAYYDARRRVAAELAANGNSVERLFR